MRREAIVVRNSLLLRGNYVVLLILLVLGSIQYIFSAPSLESAGTVYKAVSSQAAEQAGPLRYAKDVGVVFFGLLMTPSVLHATALSRFSFLRFCFPWLIAVVLCGSVAYGLGTGYEPFFLAGVRWLLLLYCGLGVYVLVATRPFDSRAQLICQRVLFLICLLDLYFQIQQLGGINLTNVIGSRLPGVFSSAITAGYFALAIEILLSGFKRSSISLLLSAMLAAIAVLSGTRFALLGIFLLWFAQIYRALDKSSVTKLFQGILVLVFPFVLAGAYYLISFVAGRGDLLASQVGANSRIGNLELLPLVLSDASQLDLLFGRGLGMGTNTAISMALSNGLSFGDLPWNIFIDNTFVTTFLQVGFVGSGVFWIGVVYFFWRNSVSSNLAVYAVLALGLFAQNLFEHYFLVLCTMATLGTSYGLRLREAISANKNFAPRCSVRRQDQVFGVGARPN